MADLDEVREEDVEGDTDLDVKELRDALAETE